MPEEKPKNGDIIIFMDVESLPCDEDDPLWIQLRDKMELRENETPEDFSARVAEAHHRTCLMGILGRPWMIGYAVGNKPPVVLRSEGTPESEKDLLSRFESDLNHILMSTTDKGSSYRRKPWWIGHNIRGFDLPFLQARALHHGLLTLAQILGRLRLKPWEKRVLDTMDLWPRTGGERHAYRDTGMAGTGKLDTICAVLGIEQQQGLMGKDMYQAWLDGNQDGAAEHLDADVRQVRTVFKHLWPLL